MSPKTNIIILIIVAVIAFGAIGYYYFYCAGQIDWAGKNTVTDNTILNGMRSANANLIKLESENIRLFYPEPPFEFKAGSEVEVVGEARVFENVVEAELAYRDGQVIEKKNTMTNAKDMGLFGRFTFKFKLPDDVDGKKVKITVFNSSPKDGARENEVYFPVKIIK